MDAINNFLVVLDGYLGGSNWFPYLLLGTGLFFTIYLKFPQIRFFRHAARVLTGRYEKKSFTGDTTHFQSLSTALSSTIGTGNIGGVGLAIYIGGPAALFWMWATAFLGMTTKFVECTLAHKYRIVGDDGKIVGGPMYYMERKLKMKWLAVIFAIATIICAFGTGNMPQINNIANAMQASFGVAPWISGAVLSVCLFMIIIGGIDRIAKVAETLVPAMCLIYIIGSLAVILKNAGNIIPSFISIFSSIFSGTAALGGFLGASFAYAFTRGVNRGLYSNEAGQGSAAIAHSAAKANEPVSEGMVSILEPFIDTLVVCTVTGLVVLASGAWTQKFPNTFQRADMQIVQSVYHQDNPDHVKQLALHLRRAENDPVKPFSGRLTLTDGRIAPDTDITVIHARSIAEDVIVSKQGQPFSGEVNVQNGQLVDAGLVVNGKSLVHSAVLTTEAFKKGFLGDHGQYVVSIGLLLFAFTTIVGFSYYGDRAVTYLLGSGFVLPYRILYIMAHFAAALIDTTIIWSLAAVAIVVMTVPNLFAILMLHKDMKQSVKEYWIQFKAEHPKEVKRLGISFVD